MEKITETARDRAFKSLNRSKSVSVGLTPADYTRYRNVALSLNMKWTDWIRMAMEKAANDNER